MKKLFIILTLLPVLAYSQKREEAENKVQEGVTLHDEGKYDHALKVYEEALTLDKDNLLALSEMAMTLNAAKQYDKSIEICKRAIETHKKEDVKNVYVSYANSLDHLNQPDKAIKIYDEGIKKYPDYHQLYFNKGVTLANFNQLEKSILAFQQATRVNPNHSSSFNALGVLEQKNRIASILAISRYLTLDNKSSRAKGNYEIILKNMSQGVSQKDDKSISLVLDPNVLDGVEKGKKTENNFSTTDMILSMAAALDYDDKNKDKTPCQKFITKFETICSSLTESKKGGKGYYWEFLAPYFIEMNSKKLVEPFSYIIFLPSQSEDVLDYHKTHAAEIKNFNDWSSSYQWK
ncbi:tetratricopeptide repeat protein [Flavobacterium amniphilum]|uniref:tetratricopeptide repeat protein n=1 Tax=Flavobacterium amniphilum TaxID=1834035 RepID=UPI00202AA23D|nr:tetratricopeptide repeat protein [Flavobacterium amniphilum]MCL9804951.1 tetratricopeptide repeat protein [Flavobacterium amniphilum]